MKQTHVCVYRPPAAFPLPYKSVLFSCCRDEETSEIREPGAREGVAFLSSHEVKGQSDGMDTGASLSSAQLKP